MSSYSLEDVKKKVSEIHHPEIALSLVDLGMVRDDIELNGESVKLTLLIPFMGIPDMIKNMLVESLANPIREIGLVPEISIDVMDESSREKFFNLENSNWKGL